MCCRPIWQDVFDLEELVRSVSANNGESKALGAFSKRCLKYVALQLSWISSKPPHSPARLLCCGT